MPPPIKDAMCGRQSELRAKFIERARHQTIDKNVDEPKHTSSQQNRHPVRQTSEPRKDRRIIDAAKDARLKVSDRQRQTEFFLRDPRSEGERTGNGERFVRSVVTANNVVSRTHEWKDVVCGEMGKRL